MARAMGTRIAMAVTALALALAGALGALVLQSDTDSSIHLRFRPSPAGVDQWIQDHTIPT